MSQSGANVTRPRGGGRKLLGRQNTRRNERRPWNLSRQVGSSVKFDRGVIGRDDRVTAWIATKVSLIGTQQQFPPTCLELVTFYAL